MSKIWFGHFDSTEVDVRELTAEDWAAYMRTLITDGIRNGGTNLQVSSPETGLYIQVNEGIANVQGYIFINNSDENGKYHIFNYPPPDEDKKRVDRVVMRLDRRGEYRTLLPVVKIGVASDNPLPPELTRNENIWEISLARVTVLPQAINITNASIEDERFDTDLCGLMNSLLKLDTSAWQTEFDNLTANIAAQHQEALLAEEAKFLEQYQKWQSDFAQLDSSIVGWYSSVKNDITKLQTFNFDNLEALDYVTRVTTFDGNPLIERIVNTLNGRPIAERSTLEHEDGSTTEQITVYAEDGVSIMKQAEIVSVINPDGSITEMVTGFDDYSLTPAYKTGDEYENPDFPEIANVGQGLDVALTGIKNIGWNG